MASIVQGSGHAAVTQPISNPGAPAAQAVAITDGEGNIVPFSGGQLGVAVTNSPTVFAVEQPASNLYSESTTPRTSNGNTANQTWIFNVSQVFVGVNVTAFTGGTSFIVQLQQQDANGAWQTIAASSAISAIGTSTFSVGTGMTNGAMLVAGGTYRFAWVLTGAFSALSFQIGAHGR